MAWNMQAKVVITSPQVFLKQVVLTPVYQQQFTGTYLTIYVFLFLVNVD